LRSTITRWARALSLGIEVFGCWLGSAGLYLSTSRCLLGSPTDRLMSSTTFPVSRAWFVPLVNG
jgi:hypothetical protein